MVLDFESPTIFFDDEVQMFGKKNDYTEQAMLQIFGLSETIKMATNYAEFSCVFYQNFDSCPNRNNIDSICKYDAQKVSRNKNGEGCLMYNSLQLLGFKE